MSIGIASRWGKEFLALLQSVVQVQVNDRRNSILSRENVETWRLRAQYDLNGTRHHRSRCKAIFVNKRTREGSVPLTRCRIPGLLFLFPFPDQPTVQYVRHVCLKNIFFSEDLLYELLFPSARGELLFARKQDWINVICNVAQESRKRICVVRTGQK